MATSIIRESSNMKLFNVPGNTTLTIPLNRYLDSVYMVSCESSTTPSMFVAIGTGYGAGTLRHTINTLIPTSLFSVTPSSDQYGIDITNNDSASWPFFLYTFKKINNN